MRTGLMFTSYCLMKAPKLTMSATPGVMRRYRSTSQSSIERSSVELTPSPFRR